MTTIDAVSDEARAKAQPGDTVVETIDAEAVNAKERRSLYAKRVKIHPKRAKGKYRSIKWIVMAVTLSIYYFTPWIRWDRGASSPDQAVLIDFAGQRFYFFFIEIWPQEVYYITGLLILAAFSLFLVTSLAGRVWCGYSCPQTVWTDLFITVERWIEGDRNARIKLDRAAWSGSKLGKRVVKHSIWLVIALATGGAWVFYFADAPTLAKQLLVFEAPTITYVFIGIFSFTTYLLGGFAREQVCTYMCPWPRIQGALFDEDSLLVTYRGFRGEPRGKHKKGESWDGRGDCIDCNQCVAVCPMGIDIRDGPQLECIQCALCIDACNSVMERVQRPPNLIAYDTFYNLQAEAEGGQARLRLLRPRTMLYGALILLVSLIMLGVLVTRDQLDLSVLRDRNPLFVTLSDGAIRNGYTLKILNKVRDDRTFDIALEGLPGAELTGVGLEPGQNLEVTVNPDRVRSVKVFVTAQPSSLAGEENPIRFIITDREDGTSASEPSVFRGPG